MPFVDFRASEIAVSQSDACRAMRRVWRGIAEVGIAMNLRLGRFLGSFRCGMGLRCVVLALMARNINFYTDTNIFYVPTPKTRTFCSLGENAVFDSSYLLNYCDLRLRPSRCIVSRNLVMHLRERTVC